MPLISNRRQGFEPDADQGFNDEPLLPTGSHVVVMRPWPAQFKANHKVPFKDKQSNSWILNLEGVTNNGQKGGVVQLWLECDSTGQILGTSQGEGYWKQISAALQLPDTDEFDTTALAWAYLKVNVEAWISQNTGKEGNKIPFKAHEETINRCTPEEQEMATDYMAKMHPEIM